MAALPASPPPDPVRIQETMLLYGLVWSRRLRALAGRTRQMMSHRIDVLNDEMEAAV